MKAHLRILLVEDQEAVGEAILSLLKGAGLDDPMWVRSLRAARAALRDQPPDLVLLDLGLPDGHGRELISDLRTAAVPTPVLVLTSVLDDEEIVGALRAGANGYLWKGDLGERLLSSVGETLAGLAPLSSAASAALVRQLPPLRPLGPGLTLTSKELAVLEILATGASYAEIGRSLGIGINTVRTHIRSLYEKLGVENRAEGVNLAWKLGLLNTP